jgi:hypothetical protein
MTRVILDDAALAKLRRVTTTAEVCDPEGHVIGQFIPIVSSVPYVGLEPDISEEELQRRERQGGGRTLAEIMKDLEKRA